MGGSLDWHSVHSILNKMNALMGKQEVTTFTGSQPVVALLRTPITRSRFVPDTLENVHIVRCVCTTDLS